LECEYGQQLIPVIIIAAIDVQTENGYEWELDQLIQPIMDCSIYQLPNVDNVPLPGKTRCLDAV
jgi:hypothetical protein